MEIREYCFVCYAEMKRNKDCNKYDKVCIDIRDKFKEKDWDSLIALFQKEKTKKIIENFDRDYPTKFLFKLILNEPRFLYFIRFLI